MEQNTKNDPKNPISLNFVKQKMRFFLMSEGSFSPKIRFLGLKVCSVARGQRDRQTDMKVKTGDILSRFQEFLNFSFNLLSRSGSITYLQLFSLQ